MQEIAGENWDIIGFDPRGIHFSTPLANCSFNLTMQSAPPRQLGSRSVPRLADSYFESFIDYGISYGTFLGQTFASMFPERVGNVMLDGNVSPAGFLRNFVDDSINHLDGIVGAFFIYCQRAGAARCPYSAAGSIAMDTYERFNRSFAQLDAQRALAENWTNATEIESALLPLKVGWLTAADDPISTFGVMSASF